ncbi:MAG: hypothetical protein U9N86_11070 [Bacteroidota bacterium]|nr:hypothetical protein [Bacteroidota bacterium]
MKRLLFFSSFLLLVFSSSAFSQIGVGIGSHGLNIRTNPDARTGIILRTGFGLTANPLETYVRPEAAWIKRHHYSEKAKLYAGLGISSEMRLSMRSMEFGYGLMIPIGVELFPMDSKKLSISLETGLSFLEIGNTNANFGNYGLLEITFYLDHHPDN